MGIFSFFRKKEHTGHTLDEEDRQFSLDLRRKNAILKGLEQERRATLAQIELEKAKYELDRLRYEMDDREEDDEPQPTSMDAILPLILAKFLGGNQNLTPVSQTVEPLTNSKVELTEEQVKDVVKSVARYKDIILSMNKETVFAIAKSKLGNISDSSLDQLYDALRNE